MTEVSEKLRSQLLRDEGLGASTRLEKPHSADRLTRNSVFSCQSTVCTTLVRYLTNSTNFCIAQCGEWVRLASMYWRRLFRAMTNGVSDVGTLRVPSQVIKRIVQWISIVVTSLLSMKWKSSKGKQDKAMDSLSLELSFNSQIHGSAVRFAATHPNGLLEDSPWLQLNREFSASAFPIAGSYLPFLRSFVVGKSWNWYPHD